MEHTTNIVPVFGDVVGCLDDSDNYFSIARTDLKTRTAILLVGRTTRHIPFADLKYHSSVGSVRYFHYEPARAGHVQGHLQDRRLDPNLLGHRSQVA